MDHLGTGVITKLESGRFDNQYNVEITLLDGTKLTGYDGIQVYDKKKDGDIPKVWPLVKKSFTDGVPFSWKGNVKTSDTKAGMKVYATLVFAEGSDGAGAVTASQTPPPNASAPSDTSGWGSPPQSDWGVGPTETVKDPALAAVQTRITEKISKDETTRQIEAGWAIKTAVQNLGPGAEDMVIHTRAHELIVMKERIAAELAGMDG